MNEQALKDRLRNIAKEKGISFNECLQKLFLERFLVRLSASSQSNNFIFKGGLLLSYLMEIGRETVDLDFLLTKMKARKDSIQIAIQTIISKEMKDGFVFTYESIEPLTQPHMNYEGYRVTLIAKFGQMKNKIQIDIGIGDSVIPINRNIPLFQYGDSSFFEGEISLSVYPLEFIFAEKLETVISKGSLNSRMKDYHDLLLMIRNEKNLIDQKKLVIAIENTFKTRGTELKLIVFDEFELKTLEKFWSAHLRNLGNISVKLNLPREIQTVISKINIFCKEFLF